MPEDRPETLNDRLHPPLVLSWSDLRLIRFAHGDPDDIVDRDDLRRWRSAGAGLIFVGAYSFCGAFAFVHGILDVDATVSTVVAAGVAGMVASFVVRYDQDTLGTTHARLDEVGPLGPERTLDDTTTRTLDPVIPPRRRRRRVRYGMAVIMAVVVFQSLDVWWFKDQVANVQRGDQRAQIAALTAPESPIAKLRAEAKALRRPEPNAAAAVQKWERVFAAADQEVRDATGPRGDCPPQCRYWKGERRTARRSLALARQRAGRRGHLRAVEARAKDQEAADREREGRDAILEDVGGLSDHAALFRYLYDNPGAMVYAVLLSIVLLVLDLTPLSLKLSGTGSLYERRRALRQIDEWEHTALVAGELSADRLARAGLRREVLDCLLKVLPLRVAEAVRDAIAAGALTDLIRGIVTAQLAGWTPAGLPSAEAAPHPPAPPPPASPTPEPESPRREAPVAEPVVFWRSEPGGVLVPQELDAGSPLVGARRHWTVIAPRAALGSRSRQLLAETADGAHGTIVALVKVPSVSGGVDPRSGRQRERAQQEMTIAQRLPRHKNIVEALDWSPDPRDPWIAMQYASRGTLETWTAEHPRGPLRERLVIIAQLGAGLAAAREADILHLDVHPGNALVFADEDYSRAGTVLRVPQIKLADWGSARMLGRTDSAVGVRPEGRWRYASADAWREPRSIDARDDLHPLGVILWELITGHVPPHLAALGDRPDAEAMVKAAHRRQLAPRVEDRIEHWVAGLPPGLARDLNALFDRLLAGERDGRGRALPNPYEPLERELFDLAGRLGEGVARGEPEVLVDHGAPPTDARSTPQTTAGDDDDLGIAL